MKRKSVFIETYGCQMNEADTEIVKGILGDGDFNFTNEKNNADVIFINTCSVRDNAEQRVNHFLENLNGIKRMNPSIVVGVLGCMAERLRTELIEKNNIVDIVVGPDEYRKLPTLIFEAINGSKGIAVKLSRFENYDDIIPLRKDGINAWLSVMRGCDKFCTFCVVPFTRGRERSRTLNSVLNEIKILSEQGFKDVTLLGQNVNSYRDENYDFADLMDAVSNIDSKMRIRFTTSHPEDMSDKLINVIAEKENICKSIHLPVQSGSDRILQLMNRTYTVKHYLNLIEKIKKQIPNATLSTDIMSSFPTENEFDHKATIDLIKEVEFDGSYTFKYSARENTKAFLMNDETSEEIKLERLNEIITVQREISTKLNFKMIGTVEEILIESDSAKSTNDWMGRTDGNKSTIIKKNGYKIGDLVKVKITKTNSATLFGEEVKLNEEVLV